MDNEQVLKRIIDILNSQNSNLLLGNITSPRPGTICQVSNRYGINSAYNLNCTYPGDAYIVWDKDEKQYYAFTINPRRVISSKQLSFRKNREVVVKKKGIGGYVWLLDSNMEGFPVAYDVNLQVFFADILDKLNLQNNKLYTLSFNTAFLDPNLGQSSINFIYPKLVNYLTTQKGVQISTIQSTELNKVDSVFYLPLPSPLATNSSYNITFSESDIAQLKQIAKNYGLIIQSEHGKTQFDFINNWRKYNRYILNVFYNPMNTVDLLDTDLIDVDYPSIKSTLKNSKDLLLGVALTGLISTSKLQPEQALTITPDNYSNVIYWKAN